MQEKTILKMAPSFGFINGLATTSSFLIPAIALGIMGMLGLDAKIAAPLFIAFAIVVRVTGDWVFWTKMFPKEMDSGENLRNWRSLVKDLLFSRPDAIKSILDMFMDFAADVWLVYVAWKTSISPAWIVFVFLGCQAVVAPVQGIVVDRLNRRNYRLFSMIITALVVVTSMGINNGATFSSYVHLFGLSYFDKSIQVLVVLGTKCLLTGSTVIAKTTIAEIIKIETLKKY